MAPYALAGDDGDRYYNWNIDPGTHTIRAVSYSGKNATGSPGKIKQITIVVRPALDQLGGPGNPNI